MLNSIGRPNDAAQIRLALVRLAELYPLALREAAMKEIPRQTFHVSTVVSLAEGGAVADIGGGFGLFSVGCAVAGMTATLIDDFGDPINKELGWSPLGLHERFGVRIVSRDVIADGLGLAVESMDVITSFDSMEHWHNSPKTLFAEVMACLKPGGWFFLGVPNCVNLRKRLTVPFGHGKWSSMEDWYEQPTFRGHVREADVSDLRYIARDMGLVAPKVMGRNWLGYANSRRWMRVLTKAVDLPLRLWPSLCSDLYLLGQKQAPPPGADP